MHKPSDNGPPTEKARCLPVVLPHISRRKRYRKAPSTAPSRKPLGPRERRRRADAGGVVRRRTLREAGNDIRPSPGGADLFFHSGCDASASATISNGGGAIIGSVSLQLLFWGSSWAGTPSPGVSNVISAVNSILEGPYMKSLRQYGVSQGSLTGAWIITSPDPPNPFSDDDAHRIISDLIDQGSFPEPDDPGGRNLYMLILPANVSSDQKGVIGEHLYDSDYDFPFDFDKAWFGWVTHDGTLDSLTATFSHELAEACSDPEGDGIQINPTSSTNWNEICDVCCSTARLEGILVQSYWSDHDKACVIPTDLERAVLYDRNAGQADVVGFDTTGTMNADVTNSGWRSSWDVIVTGDFLQNGQKQLVLYDRSAGQADVVGFDGTGNLNLDNTNSGWRTSWDLIVVGDFVGNGRDQVVLYDRNAGQADVVGFDGIGNLNLDTTNSGWRTSWDLIAAGDFIGNGLKQLLLYDRNAGQADMVGFDGTGNVNLDNTNSGWRTSWDLIVVGDFVGNGQDQILLYDRSAGQADVVGFDATGNLNLDITSSGWPTTWDVLVVGEFIANGRDQVLLYDRNAGVAAVAGFDATGALQQQFVFTGWRTSWDLIVAGEFLGNGQDQILLYDRSAGQADVVGLDTSGNINMDTTNSGWRTTWGALAVL